MDNISIKMSLHFKYIKATTEVQMFSWCISQHCGLYWLWKCNTFSPKTMNTYTWNQPASVFPWVVSTIKPYNFPKASSYQPNNICYYFLDLPLLGSRWKNTTKLLSKCILMAQHNSITLTVVFIFVFYYLKIYCSVA